MDCTRLPHDVIPHRVRKREVHRNILVHIQPGRGRRGCCILGREFPLQKELRQVPPLFCFKRASIHLAIVSNGTYIAFLSLTVVGFMLPLLMVDPRKMIRSDGTKVTAPRHPSWKTEFYGLWVALRTDPLIVLLFPMFFASNWFYTWRESCWAPTRSFNAKSSMAHRIQRVQWCLVQYPYTGAKQLRVLDGPDRRLTFGRLPSGSNWPEPPFSRL